MERTNIDDLKFASLLLWRFVQTHWFLSIFTLYVGWHFFLAFSDTLSFFITRGAFFPGCKRGIEWSNQSHSHYMIDSLSETLIYLEYLIGDLYFLKDIKKRRRWIIGGSIGCVVGYHVIWHLITFDYRPSMP